MRCHPPPPISRSTSASVGGWAASRAVSALTSNLTSDTQVPAPGAAPEAPQTSPVAPGATEAPDTTITAPPQRRPASAQERAARIWHTIQAWNETPGRRQDEKIALSASTLEKRFGIYRPAAQQFMAEHQAEIIAHAQAHSITAPAHNRGVPDPVWEILKEQAAQDG